MLPSGDAVGPDRRFIVARSVSVIGRAKAGVDRVVAPNNAASIKVFVMPRKLVSVIGARKKIAVHLVAGAFSQGARFAIKLSTI
jgi:hypothetical protein